MGAEVCTRAETAGHGVRLWGRVPLCRGGGSAQLEAESRCTGAKPRELERSRVNGLPGKK